MLFSADRACGVTICTLYRGLFESESGSRDFAMQLWKKGHLQVVSLCSVLQHTCKANKGNKVDSNGNKVVDLQM